MQLTFDNHYIVAVIVFMVTILFCKNMLECMQKCMEIWQAVMCQDLCFCPCVNVSHAMLVKQCVYNGISVFSVFQPLFLLVAKSMADKMDDHASFWTVNLGYVELDADVFEHMLNKSVPMAMPKTPCKFTFSEVDAILLVMPYSLLAASSAWTWVSLQNENFFSSDPQWNSEVFADARMQLYELLYAGELFLLLFALLCITADPTNIEYAFVYAMLLAFLMMFFCAQSRQNKPTDSTEHMISMIIFSLLCTLVSFFVVQHWSGGCATKRSSGVLLVLVVISLSIMHMSTQETTTVGSVILLRTVVANACSLYFIVLISQNPNSWCQKLS